MAVDPLDRQTPIVVKETGSPSPYFQRQWQGLLALVRSVQEALAAAIAAQASAAALALPSYVTLTTSATLTNERVLTAGDQITVTDAGAGSTVTVATKLKRVLQIQVSDPNGSAITTGDGKAYVRINSLLNGWNLIALAAHVTTVSSSGIPTVQIHNVTQTADMLSTALTIDASEKDSKDATTPAVIDTGNDDVATGDELRIDIDVAGTGTKGLIVELTFQEP